MLNNFLYHEYVQNDKYAFPLLHFLYNIFLKKNLINFLKNMQDWKKYSYFRKFCHSLNYNPNIYLPVNFLFTSQKKNQRKRKLWSTNPNLIKNDCNSHKSFRTNQHLFPSRKLQTNKLPKTFIPYYFGRRFHYKLSVKKRRNCSERGMGTHFSE